MHFCRQEARRVRTFVISVDVAAALVIAAHPHTKKKKSVNTNVPSTFPCSGQRGVALSSAAGVSFSLFTRPAFVKIP